MGHGAWSGMGHADKVGYGAKSVYCKAFGHIHPKSLLLLRLERIIKFYEAIIFDSVQKAENKNVVIVAFSGLL